MIGTSESDLLTSSFGSTFSAKPKCGTASKKAPQMRIDIVPKIPLDFIYPDSDKLGYVLLLWLGKGLCRHIELMLSRYQIHDFEFYAPGYPQGITRFPR